MRFVEKKETFQITYKAHDQDEHAQPVLYVYRADGALHASGQMQHMTSGLYTYTITAPDEDCFLVARVGADGGTIVVGYPKTTKIFYYDHAPESIHYELRDPKTLKVLQQGNMFSIGHELYVISTTLDGLVQVIAGKREGALVMLPLRQGNLPVIESIKIIGEYNKVTTRRRDRR